MSPPHPPPPKKEVALALLERSSMFVHLDPRLESVKVPPWFKKQPQLVLQVGLNMAIPIPDLHLDEEGLACTLSFSHSPFYCVVPWGSVFALVSDDGSGRGMVWEKDMPVELHQAAQKQKAPAAKPKVVAEAPSEPAPVAAVEADASAASSPSAAPEEAGEKPKRARRKAAPKEAEKPVVAKKPAPIDAERLPVVMQPLPPPPPQPMRAPQSPIARRPAPQVGLAPKKPKRELPPYLRVVK